MIDAYKRAAFVLRGEAGARFTLRWLRDAHDPGDVHRASVAATLKDGDAAGDDLAREALEGDGWAAGARAKWAFDLWKEARVLVRTATEAAGLELELPPPEAVERPAGFPKSASGMTVQRVGEELEPVAGEHPDGPALALDLAGIDALEKLAARLGVASAIDGDRLRSSARKRWAAFLADPDGLSNNRLAVALAKHGSRQGKVPSWATTRGDLWRLWLRREKPGEPVDGARIATHKAELGSWRFYQLDPDRLRVLPVEVLPAPFLRRLAWVLWRGRWRAEAEDRHRIARASRTPRALTAFPLGADTTAVRVAAGLTGDPLATGNVPGERLAQPREVEITWADGAQLSLPFDDGAGPLVAVARQYGNEVLAHLMNLLMLHWTTGRASSDPFLWFPSEHLAIMNQDGSHAHERMHDALAKLAGATMRAKYQDGTRTAKLADLVVVEKDGKGAIIGGNMLVHPALTWPVSGGRAWWPAPVELVGAIPGATRDNASAAVLAVMMAQQWSIGANREDGPVFRKDLPALARAMGRPQRRDRSRDRRTVASIEAAAAELERVGHVSESGFDGDVFWARPALMRDGRRLNRPPLLPATGIDLALWLAAEGRPMTEIAADLGVNARTLKRNTKRGDRLVTAAVRAGLRRYLWEMER